VLTWRQYARGCSRGIGSINRPDRRTRRLGIGAWLSPTSARILPLTAGSSMLAIARTGPPHALQVSMSMWNGRRREEECD
jgi:hypothetical protein